MTKPLNRKSLDLTDFSGGRNTADNNFKIEKNETRDQWNVWAEDGSLIKRRGWTQVDSSITGEANNIIRMVLTNLGGSNAPRAVMMGRKGNTTSHVARLTFTDDGATFANCQGSPTLFSGASVPYMGMFGGELYVSNGLDDVVKYDGATVSVVAAFPKYSKCAVHKNYVFAAKGARLKWSDARDATTWPTNNFHDIYSDDGEPIIAIFPFSGALLIFKRRSMYMFVGDYFNPKDQQYYLQKIDTPDNFIFLFGQTIVAHNGALKFLTVDGFYAYDGGSGIYKISEDIQPDIDLFLNDTSVYDVDNDVEVPNVFPKSYIWKNSMVCSIVYGGNRRIIVQDKRGKWWIHVDPSFAAGALEALTCNLGSGEKLYGGLSNYSFFLTLDTGFNINGNALTAYWVSRDFIFASDVAFKYVEIFLKKQAVGVMTFSFSIDDRDYVEKTVDMKTGTGTMVIKTVPIERIGKTIRLKLRNSEVDAEMEISGIKIWYERGFRGRP